MNKEILTAHLSQLGQLMIEVSNDLENSPYTELFQKAKTDNAWFTNEFMQHAFLSIGKSLSGEKIEQWLNAYSIPENTNPKTIGLVLAGNLPLVGLHDILCVLVSGHHALIKLSSKDQHLYKIVAELLFSIDASYNQKLIFTENTIKDVDAIIATGSDNSARYFEYYFGKYPHIIRKNRNSLALLTGNESDEELKLLGADIFTYFGLGCRNISHLMLPKDFNLDMLFRNFEPFNDLINHNKYANNYDYQKAIMLLNQTPFLDNGLVLIKQEQSLASPIGVLHYQYYEKTEDVTNFVTLNDHKIQCVVSKTKWSFPTYELGTAQQPELWDYADNVDTIDFLLNLK